MTKIKYGLIIQITSLALLLISLTAPCFSSEIPAEKMNDIKKLLAVSGIGEQLAYMKRDLLSVFSAEVNALYPKVPAEFWKEFDDIMISELEMEHLIENIAPVYDQHMDHQTIKKLIVMFDNPFWEEWKQKMPIISREAGKAGGLWIQDMAQSKKLRERMEFLMEKYDLENLNQSQNQKK